MWSSANCSSLAQIGLSELCTSIMFVRNLLSSSTHEWRVVGTFHRSVIFHTYDISTYSYVCPETWVLFVCSSWFFTLISFAARPNYFSPTLNWKMLRWWFWCPGRRRCIRNIALLQQNMVSCYASQHVVVEISKMWVVLPKTSCNLQWYSEDGAKSCA